MKTCAGGLLVGKLADLLVMFVSKSGRGEFISFFGQGTKCSLLTAFLSSGKELLWVVIVG
jgi:hypothetical protein